MKGVFLAVKFGKDLHLARWGRGESLLASAEKVGVTAMTIGTYENATSTPRLDIFWAVCDEFGLNPSDYFKLVPVENGDK